MGCFEPTEEVYKSMAAKPEDVRADDVQAEEVTEESTKDEAEG